MSARSMIARLAPALLRLVGAATLIGAVAPALAQSSPSDFTSATRYDLMHRVVGSIAPDPDGSGSIHYAAVRNTYDAAGNLITVEKGELSSWQADTIAPAAWTGFTVFQTIDTTYDVMDRKLTEKLSHGTTAYALTQYSYDAMGRLECTAVRMNTAAYTSLPSSACTLGTAGSYGPDRITKNVYDAVSHLLKVQKAYGVTTANGFPATLQQDYATYTYSDNGKQTSVTDANGNKAAYTYDGFDRQVAWAFPSKTTAGTAAACTIGTITETSGVVSPSETRTSGDDCEKYAYDKNGNRMKLMKRDGNVIRYAYDALNRVTLKDIPGSTSADVYYAYDLRGLQSYARFASTSGSGLTNSYDGFGRLSSTSSDLDGTARALSYRYDADGNRTRITHPDSNYFTYVYDGLNRAIAVQENGSTQVASFTYDAQGGRSADGRGTVVTTYGYDDVSRLNALNHDLSGTSSDVTWGLSYSPSNQIAGQSRDNDSYAFTGYSAVSKTYTVNSLNQYTAADSASPTYDDNGNLTSDGTTGYTYDVENRLTATSAGAVLDYDPSGRLWQMTMGTSTVRFLYDGDQLLEERDGSGTLLRRYVHGNEEDDPLLWYDGSGLSDRRSFQVDHQGSITSIANADGTLRTIDSYDEYGMPGSANDGRFQYTGQAWLPALGLYYYKARIYSPKLGRFLQTDPIGYKDDNNLYAYVGNDPIDREDPTGLCPNCVTGAIGAVAGGLLGGLSQVAEDVVSGKVSNFEDYAGAIAGGAVTGGIIGSTGQVTLGSGVGAAAGDAVKQSIAIARGHQAGGYNAGQTIRAGLLGATTGRLLGGIKVRAPGITNGNGSWAHVAKSMIGRVTNGTGGASARTLLKGVGAEVVGNSAASATEGGVKGGAQRIPNPQLPTLPQPRSWKSYLPCLWMCAK